MFTQSDSQRSIIAAVCATFASTILLLAAAGPVRAEGISPRPAVPVANACPMQPAAL